MACATLGHSRQRYSDPRPATTPTRLKKPQHSGKASDKTTLSSMATNAPRLRQCLPFLQSTGSNSLPRPQPHTYSLLVFIKKPVLPSPTSSPGWVRIRGPNHDLNPPDLGNCHLRTCARAAGTAGKGTEPSLAYRADLPLQPLTLGRRSRRNAARSRLRGSEDLGRLRRHTWI